MRTPPPDGPEKEHSREQVAAVCYRLRKLEIEFLLVRTRKGRWTFPKGGLVPGLTSAQSAALEAFEEAGVHGRIEQAAFAKYVLRKGRNGRSTEITTRAHLCEVQQIGIPKEPGRSPTWFSIDEAQASLSERRKPEDADELARVVNRAASRIRRITARSANFPDPLQKVRFEAFDSNADLLIARLASFPQVRPKGEASSPAVIEFRAGSRRLLQLGPGRRLPH